VEDHLQYAVGRWRIGEVTWSASLNEDAMERLEMHGRRNEGGRKTED
jgi:hypothetical protein